MSASMSPDSIAGSEQTDIDPLLAGNASQIDGDGMFRLPLELGTDPVPEHTDAEEKVTGKGRVITTVCLLLAPPLRYSIPIGFGGSGNGTSPTNAPAGLARNDDGRSRANGDATHCSKLHVVPHRRVKVARRYLTVVTVIAFLPRPLL